jgi:hypothetical protein
VLIERRPAPPVAAVAEPRVTVEAAAAPELAA